MTASADQLVEQLRKAAAEVFDGTEVFLAYAYGSRIEGNPRPDSDLDVAYYAGGYPDPTQLPLKEQFALAGRLAEALRLEVDLRPLAGTPLPFRGRVLERGTRIYCSDEVARVNLERVLLSRWCEWKPTYSRLCRTFLKRVAERGFSHGG